jgi:hypothetical protein
MQFQLLLYWIEILIGLQWKIQKQEEVVTVEIVTETYRGEILRYFVIETPINETGICFEFKTKEAAQAYIDEHNSNH